MPSRESASNLTIMYLPSHFLRASSVGTNCSLDVRPFGSSAVTCFIYERRALIDPVGVTVKVANDCDADADDADASSRLGSPSTLGLSPSQTNNKAPRDDPRSALVNATTRNSASCASLILMSALLRLCSYARPSMRTIAPSYPSRKNRANNSRTHVVIASVW
jgi:hypothetical protein